MAASSSSYLDALKNPPATGHFSLFPPVFSAPKEGEKQIRVYADGVYDMFHHGHARSLKQAKEVVPNAFLIVGVCSDTETTAMKGKTLMNELERAEQVLHCRYVDQVVVRSPWVLTQAFLDEYQIDYVVHGEDNSYDENGNDAYAFVKAQGKYKTIKRTDGVSTTDLIIRILKDYNGYVERCMRRGFTYQELNIPENVWNELQHHIKVGKKYIS